MAQVDHPWEVYKTGDSECPLMESTLSFFPPAGTRLIAAPCTRHLRTGLIAFVPVGVVFGAANYHTLPTQWARSQRIGHLDPGCSVVVGISAVLERFGTPGMAYSRFSGVGTARGIGFYYTGRVHRGLGFWSYC